MVKWSTGWKRSATTNTGSELNEENHASRHRKTLAWKVGRPEASPRRSDHQGCHGGPQLWRGVGFCCDGRGQIQGLDRQGLQAGHQGEVGQALQEAGIRPA